METRNLEGLGKTRIIVGNICMYPVFRKPKNNWVTGCFKIILFNKSIATLAIFFKFGTINNYCFVVLIFQICHFHAKVHKLPFIDVWKYWLLGYHPSIQNTYFSIENKMSFIEFYMFILIFLLINCKNTLLCSSNL